MKQLQHIIANVFITVGGIGYLPVVGPVLSAFLAYGSLHYADVIIPEGIPARLLIFLGWNGILYALAIPSIRFCMPKENIDSHTIVIDEYIGASVALLPLFLLGVFPLHLALSGLAVFLILDGLKPFGIADIDRRNTPASVILDDIAAGLLAAVAVMGWMMMG